MPWLEVHHIVVIEDKSYKKGGVYTVDFSPLDQKASTLMKLLMGRSVPGEVRIRRIPAHELNDDDIKNNIMFSDVSISCLGMKFDVSSLGSRSHYTGSNKGDYEAKRYLLSVNSLFFSSFLFKYYFS